MSFAIQCLQEGLIGHGGYVDEIEIYNRLNEFLIIYYIYGY